MTYRNEFDDPPSRFSSGGFLTKIGPKAAFFIVLIALSFMIGAVWKLYSGGGNNNGQNIPIVRADDNPFKVTPDDPGGMEIRHKDSTLFSSMKKKTGEDVPRIENLLADDENEEPMPRSQLFAGLNTEDSPEIENRPVIMPEATPTPLDQPVKSEPSNIVPDAPEPVEPVADIVAPKEIEKIIAEAKPIPDSAPAAPTLSLTPPPIVTTEPQKNPTPLVKPAAKPPAKPAPKKAPVEVRSESIPVVPKKANESAGYYVQLASTKDKARAESEWQKLSKKYSVVTGAPYRIETADLGPRGVYFRIQVGPMSRAEAQSKCTAIKKINPAGCIVKK